MKYLTMFLDVLILFIIIIVIMIICAIVINTSPVEESEDNTPLRDSLTKENNKLILDIKTIDSTNEQEQKYIKNLNNDSTVAMFYKLLWNRE